MRHRRSTFRRKGGTACNAAYFGYQAAFRGTATWSEREAVEAAFRAARALGRHAPKNLPGETNRQLAARLRAEAGAAEKPAKPARKSRAKAVAA